MFQQAGLVKETSTDHVSQFLSTSTDAEVMFCRRYPVAVKLGEPVSVGKSTAVILPLPIGSGYGSVVFGLCRVSVFSIDVVFNSGHGIVVKHRITSTICTCSVKVLCECIRVYHFGYLDRVRETYITRVVDSGFTGFTAFGCDHDNTKRSTCTINRRGGSIFQYRNIFNIIWIYCVHIAFDTVNQH